MVQDFINVLISRTNTCWSQVWLITYAVSPTNWFAFIWTEKIVSEIWCQRSFQKSRYHSTDIQWLLYRLDYVWIYPYMSLKQNTEYLLIKGCFSRGRWMSAVPSDVAGLTPSSLRFNVLVYLVFMAVSESIDNFWIMKNFTHNLSLNTKYCFTTWFIGSHLISTHCWELSVLSTRELFVKYCMELPNIKGYIWN